MKYIFLDIDGVLNSTRSCFVKIGPSLITSEDVRELAELVPDGLPYTVTFGLKCTDPICVALVNLLLSCSQATLVLSSSHRAHLTSSYTPFGSAGHLGRLARYLECMGLNVPERRFDVTPQLHRTRGEEIEAYIEEHGEPEAYVILDDGTDFFKWQPLVHVDAVAGLSFKNYADACKVLGIAEPSNIIV